MKVDVQGVFFSNGPTKKSSKYGTGPPQQEKMTKYTGPIQDLLTQKSSKYGTGTPPASSSPPKMCAGPQSIPLPF